MPQMQETSIRLTKEQIAWLDGQKRVYGFRARAMLIRIAIDEKMKRDKLKEIPLKSR